MGFQLIQKHEPDLLITDLWKSNDSYDGIFLAQVAESANPNVRVVFITATPKERVETELAALREYSYIRKPFYRAQLRALLREQQKQMAEPPETQTQVSEAPETN